MRGITETEQKEKENKVSGKKLQKWSIQEEKYNTTTQVLIMNAEGVVYEIVCYLCFEHQTTVFSTPKRDKGSATATLEPSLLMLNQCYFSLAQSDPALSGYTGQKPC